MQRTQSQENGGSGQEGQKVGSEPQRGWAALLAEARDVARKTGEAQSA